MDHILHEMFNIILNIFEKYGEKTDNPLVRIYVNKIENRNSFNIKKGYCLQYLTPEMMTLLVSTKSKITKDKIGENVAHLEITEVAFLLHCKIVNSDQ